MVVCPLCEHVQAGGAECEVCGRSLPGAAASGPAAAPAPEQRLEALEATALPDAGPVATAPFLAELEPARHPPLGAPAPDPVPGLERTGLAAAPAVAGEPVAGLEAQAGAPAERTPPPAALACRYCRTEALPGDRLCRRCGMRLPVFLARAPPPGAPGGDEVRLCGCGAPIRGPRCPSCGARHA